MWYSMSMHRRLGAVVATFALGLSLSACGNRGTAGITGIGQKPGGHLAVIADCGGNPSVKPTTIVLSCADANVLLNELHWTTWTATGATGRGQLSTNDCTPSCASGTFNQVPVTVTAGGPQNVKGQNYLSILFTTPTGGTGETAHQLTVPK